MENYRVNSKSDVNFEVMLKQSLANRNCITRDIPVINCITRDIPVINCKTRDIPVINCITRDIPVINCITRDIPIINSCYLFIYLFIYCNSLTVGLYVTQLPSNGGISFWQIVSVMTKCCFVNEILSCTIVLQGQNYSTPAHPLRFKN